VCSIHASRRCPWRYYNLFFWSPTLAQSFKHNQTWLGRQVCRPSAVHKRKRRLVADNPVTLLLWAGRQVCRPGLSWATNLSPISCQIRTKRLGYFAHKKMTCVNVRRCATQGFKPTTARYAGDGIC
jgi:hypothetical protein